MFDTLKRWLIHDALNHLFAEARRRPHEMSFDPDAQRLVCVSDLHRGKRDGADDFRRSERVYNAALAWYFRRGYHLAVLGDAEELWECSPDEVLARYKQADAKGYARSLALEARFNERDRYLRVYGNHDRLWASKRARRKLERHLGSVDVRGAIAIRVTGSAAEIGGEPAPVILLTHGDAGTLDSAVFAPISRLFVHFWAFWQKKIGALTGVPADDWELRDNADRCVYDWANGQRPGVLLVTGHTHRPVFATHTRPHVPEGAEIAARERDLDHPDDLSAETLAAGEFIVAEMRRQAMQRLPFAQERPCYFNTGACCFGDGDITAIEIADGQIRLMRWAWHPDGPHCGQIRAEVLQSAELSDVLAQILRPTEAEATVDELPLPGQIEVVHEGDPAGPPRNRKPTAVAAGVLEVSPTS